MPAGRKGPWPGPSVWRSPARAAMPKAWSAIPGSARAGCRRRPLTSRARWRSTRTPVCCNGGLLSEPGLPRMPASSAEGDRPRGGQQRVEIEVLFEVAGERIERRVDRMLIGLRARRAAQARKQRAAKTVIGEKAMHIAAGDQTVAADGPLGTAAERQHRPRQTGPASPAEMHFVARDRHGTGQVVAADISETLVVGESRLDVEQGQPGHGLRRPLHAV